MSTTPPSSAAEPAEEKAPRRSIAEIEAELARTREDLSRTVDELAVRIDPRTQAKEAVARTKEAAAETVALVQDVAEEKAVAARELATEFAGDVKAGQPRALAILAGAAAAVAGVVVAAVLAGRRR